MTFPHAGSAPRTIFLQRKRSAPDPTPIARGRRLLPALLVLMLSFAIPANTASPTVVVGFPLQGHFHPGRYMPVHLMVYAPDSGANALSIKADGAVTTDLELASGKADAVVPWLSVRGNISGDLVGQSVRKRRLDRSVHRQI